MNHPELSILIPAAGASERLGQAKQLVRYKSESLLQNAVNVALSLIPREIIVVTGANAYEVKNAVKQTPVRWIHNPHWSTGMGGSIAIGAASIKPESTGLMILLCDQWRIQTPDLKILAETWQTNPERIVIAEAKGRYMPPVIFPSACFSQLRQLQGRQGARSVLGSRAELITPIPLANAAWDLDTQEQLLEIKKSQNQ